MSQRQLDVQRDEIRRRKAEQRAEQLRQVEERARRANRAAGR